MSFSQIADVYDRFNDLSVYEYWVDYTLNSLDRKPKKMLDIACGTGWFTQLMIPFVDSVTGIDIDEDMLAIARQEVINLPNVEFKYGDMTRLSKDLKDFDLVTCYLDSLCFLNDYKAVKEAFKGMYRALSDQGTLLFDVWTPYQMTDAFSEFEYFDQDESATLIWESASDAESLSVEHYLTVYRQVEGAQFERVDVELQEQTFPLEKYMDALIEAGFQPDKIEVFVDYGSKYYDKRTDEEADRWFFRCSK
ncbi:MAG: class I SAM-dependent DNA methyltransferase [Ruoffia tabacinasalis]|uniref:class I SAM-dependent DNA methyltransferase n=1 Tax=unclassified Ruoffia TaxID=2862149 RepID=UPI0038843AA4